MKEKRIQLADRNLGHEWHEWDGSVECHEGDLNEPKRLYLGLIGLGICLLTIAPGLLLYWLYPSRVQKLGLTLVFWIAAVVVIMGTLFFLLWSAVILSIILRANIVPYRWVIAGLTRGASTAVFLGRFVGISRDRVGSSITRISNLLTRNALQRLPPCQPVLLLPRCLEAGNRENLKALAQEYECDWAIAATGEQARKQIERLRPRALVCVACERDLISGLRDVGSRLPALVIANKRPEGPCKNAYVDLGDVREALSLFTRRGKSLPSSNSEGTVAE